jgi:ubiquinone/menaquinone biosynthesis C-methylase UbiE
VKKANYTQIAETWDKARPLYDKNLELCLNLVSKRVGSKNQIKLLDLGCGTGRFAIPFANQLGYSVTAIDNSKEMIEKAKQKDADSRVDWLVQDVTDLKIAESSFDVIFISHLLHHLDNPQALIQKCYQTLKPSGVIINRYGALEHVRHDPEHRFFPEAIKLDELRCPTIKRVEAWFQNAGFTEVQSETVIQPTYTSGEDRLSRVKLKSTSVLTLISQRAFEKGLESFEKYVSENPVYPWLLNDYMTITAGHKIT